MQIPYLVFLDGLRHVQNAETKIELFLPSGIGVVHPDGQFTYCLGLKIPDQVRVLRSREKREGKTIPGICGYPSVATVSFPKFLIYKYVFQLILEKHLK